jgi:hypothetical protein
MVQCQPEQPQLRWLTLVLLAAGSGGSPAAAQQVPPVHGLVATLEDQVRELGHGRIAWSTYWKLCWDAVPGAEAYELQAVTSEGVSPELRRQEGTCFRIEAAANENAIDQGLLHRDMLLAVQASQLAYRVRAALENGRVSAWSQAAAVGERRPTPA